MKNVFDDTNDSLKLSFSQIESLRKQNLSDKSTLQFEDFGAGGDQQRLKETTVSSIVAKSVKQSKYARFLYRLGVHMNSITVVELGTSLGLTTAYLSHIPSSQVHTVEADRNVQSKAQTNWKHLGIPNIQSYCFDLNANWDQLCYQLNSIDFLFIDANHRKEAMVRYYLQALPYLHSNSVVVLDDIHWSEDMLAAWHALKARKEVTLSFDIYQMGFLFFNKDLSKENFTLKY